VTDLDHEWDDETEREDASAECRDSEGKSTPLVVVGDVVRVPVPTSEDQMFGKNDGHEKRGPIRD
jgi:hypothetical protein